MSGRFDYFIVLAEMRTGSNFLEANLNALENVACHGEAFNPHFVGYPNYDNLLGVTLEQRSIDPQTLLTLIRTEPGKLSGFRFFHDHDPRVLAICLADPRCAKIILTRNPLDSYVSWKIAQKTGQWKLTDVRRRREGKARFEPEEFLQTLDTLQQFQVTVQHALQTSGQTAYYVSYEDLQDLDVLNGLAMFLGVDARLESLDQKLKPQNPGGAASKVSNPDQMRATLADLDRFNLSRTPSFEPRRGPAVPSFVAAARTGLCYMPVLSGPESAVQAWLASLDGVTEEALHTRFTQKTLRQWLRTSPKHRFFTVIRHPLERAHAAFCDRILSTGPGSFLAIRKTLRQAYKLPLPGRMPDDAYDRKAHRDAFLGFLRFLKANLAGQTSIRIDGNWASQCAVLEGFAQFAMPDMIIRETEMDDYLPALALQVSGTHAPGPPAELHAYPFGLEDIYDDEMEALAADIYQRDYLMFGYSRWPDTRA